MTPLSDRPFRVREISTDRLQIRFDDSGEKRPLWREQFEVLTDRLAEHRLAVADTVGYKRVKIFDTTVSKSFT